MPVFLAIIIWIVVILLGAYGCFWILGQVGKYHSMGEPLLYFGYAGGYLAEALCQLGPVTGVDPRKTPEILNPNFMREWPWPRPLNYYGTSVCVSVLEHLPDLHNVDGLLAVTKPGGQVLITIPCGPSAAQFRGYRLWALKELMEWPSLHAFTVFRREEGWWRTLGPEFLQVKSEASYRVIVEHLPDSSEHQVNAVFCARLVKPDHLVAPSPTDG